MNSTPDLPPKTLKLRRFSLLVIDMLNDYLTPSGALYADGCRNIIAPIADLSTFIRENGGSVTYVNTQLTRRDRLAQKWGLHAVKGTIGAKVVDELAPQKGDLIVTKKLYDGFFQTRLSPELRKRGVDTVLLAGIHTHVCVLLTGVGAFQRGFNVIALEDCFTTGHRANHESRLRFFHSHLGELCTSADWVSKVRSPKWS